ncbi:MAG TPA: type VII secretion protein EccCa, partial [Mycobacterium sp.]|nr:type VII secretion protein EccCa [Mycobacterium sp.]
MVTAPPPPPRPAGGAMLTKLLPVAMAVAMIGMTAAVYRSGSTATRNPAFLIFPLMMLVSVAATAVTGRDRGRGSGIDSDRADYLDYLADLRGSVTNTAAAQRSSLMWCHPVPEALWMLVGGPRMWERRPGDADFGRMRIGVGSAPLTTALAPPQPHPPGRVDPVTDTALRRFLDTHAVLTDVPVTIEMFGPAVLLDGEPSCARALLRAMLCQLAVLHGPDLLLVAAVVAEANREHWDWLKWLPHQQHPGAADGTGPVRMTYPSLAAAETALVDLAGLHAVVVVDGAAIDGTEPILGAANRTVVEIGTGCVGLPSCLHLRVTETTVTVRQPGRDEFSVRPDRMALTDALVCARRLAGYRVAGSTAVAPSGRPHWPALLGIGDVTRFEPQTLWDRVEQRDRLCVPIGTDAAGNVVRLDIKEAAENGSGPHGLCIGATGSGKSEFLRTVALGMIARHSPDEVNLVLVDFKGGATFLGLEQARHVAAVITNLADEAPLVARMRDALAGELNRRQELLRTAGNFVSATAYREARRAGSPLPALPALFVVVDEFSELLSQHPDFVDMFVAIGRLGRSLGIHLLLASQRLDEGRLRGLESHLSYRVCLKTLSANESRTVLGVPDAHQLPNTPGLGYLRSADTQLSRFRTAFVSGPCPDAAPRGHGAPPAMQLFTAAPSGPVPPTGPAPGAGTTGRTVLQTVLDRLSGHGTPAREVWLPPLGVSPTLGSLLADDPGADLVVPIGIVDRPFEQRRTALLVDLFGAAGNVAVIGAPQSGKSTALATLITALAATHDPARVQLYCLDFGGGALTALRPLPQLGSVAGRTEPDLVRRTVAEMESIVAGRESLFRDRGIGSMEQYRQLRAHDPVCGQNRFQDRFGDVFLVIDGWADLCREFEGLEASITALAGRGLSFGVHVVLSASRWAEVRPGLRDQIGTRIELRLGDPADSELDRRQAHQVPRDKPGRGLTHGGLHMLIALPRQDVVVHSGDAAAPPVPMLPALVHRDELIATAGAHPALGVDERGLGVVTLDFERQPHLLVLGDNECGKTSVLRTLCHEIVRTSTAEQAQLVVVDYRRSLLGVVESNHLAGYAMSAAALTALLPDLRDRLARRMPGPEVTQQQLRDRSWWSGPQLYLLVDDYDLVASATGNPLTPLLEYLPHAGDLGLHLIVARRSGGAARAVYEPLLAGLRDLGCMGL